MNTLTLSKNDNKTPLWLKTVACIGVIWYAFGLLQFWLGFSMDTTASVGAGTITAAHAAAIESTPLLIWLAFAVASGAGLIGAILLFGRSTGAKVAFAISLISAAIYFGWVHVVSGSGADRPPEEIIIAGVVGAVTLMFFLLSIRVARAN